MSRAVHLSKAKSILLLSLIYLLSAAPVILSPFVVDRFFLALFLGDLASTFIIWVFSVIFDNVSLYDAYWSTHPLLIAIYAFIHFRAFGIYHIICLAVFAFWSIRLTYNCLLRFRGMDHEDWRYSDWRPKMGRFYHPFAFIAFMLMETVVVYIALFPLLMFFAIGASPFSLIGAGVVRLGTLMELFADIQMEKSHAIAPGKTCQIGIWKYSRHPNYLGEMLIWLGLYLMLLLSDPSHGWMHFVGFVLIVILFSFASIPMMEKRQLARRPDYEEYKKRTSVLLPLPPKK